MSHALYKQIKDLNDKMDVILKYIEEKEIISDVISEQEACTFLGIQRQTIRDYVCNGKLRGTYIVNAIGKRMYYKSRLLSLSK